MPRPPSSTRPSTSASGPGRPSTSGAFSPYDPAFEEEEFDDDDESSDEDVFAFLPPTTAEQQEQAATQAQTEPAAGGAAHQHMQYGHLQQQAASPYASNGAGTAAAVAAALQAQYYGQHHERPHVGPFSHSPFPHANAASTSTLDTAPSTGDLYSSWGRPSTSHLVAGRSVSHLPYGSGAGTSFPEADSNEHRNAYAGPSNTFPAADAYAALNRPTITHLPPQSPPSPSTDSQPSTGAGMPSHSHRGDMYKLRRLTSANSVAAAAGVVVEGGQRVAQDEDDDEDDDGYEDRRKEVRISLPSHPADPHGDEPPDSPNTKLGEEPDKMDDDAATMASEKDRAMAALRLESPPAGKGRRVRAGKNRSTDIPMSPGTYAGNAGSAEAGAVAVDVLGYDGIVASGVQVRGGDAGHRRTKNANAQPYYAYAALANAHGYDTRGKFLRLKAHIFTIFYAYILIPPSF